MSVEMIPTWDGMTANFIANLERREEVIKEMLDYLMHQKRTIERLRRNESLSELPPVQGVKETKMQ